MAEVGCAGILVSDTFCGPMPELPREGQLLAVDNLPTRAGGCAANVAIGLAKQGVSVDIAGCLGNDPSARVLLGSLEEYRLGCSRIVFSGELPTSKTVILLVAGQDRRYIHSFGANAAFSVRHIDRDWVRGLRVLYIGGLFLMPSFHTGELRELLRFCRAQGVISVVDVVIPQNAAIPGDLAPLLHLIDYFLPNDDEARLLTGLPGPQDQLRAFLQMGANTVFVTLGRHGVLAGRGGDGKPSDAAAGRGGDGKPSDAAAGRGGECWQAGVYDTQQIDPSGSGDAFAAGVVLGALRGWSILETIRYASALGASAIRAIGTTDGVFTAEQAEAFVKTHDLDIQHMDLPPRPPSQRGKGEQR